MTTVLDSLNAGLLRAFEDDPRVYLLGQDVLDPYGGAFKVTRGLSTAYPERVLSTPISEAGMTGIAAGMALRGLRPVVEIMFGDFITLAADQLINHIAKFRWMYNDQVRVPLVLRTPMGGRRGYGPTHSQSLEKLFMGVPGLVVLAPNTLNNPGELLYRSILERADPLLFVENKLLYLSETQGSNSLTEFQLSVYSGSGATSPEDRFLVHTLRLRGAPPAVLTIAVYGYMAELARQAALRLAYEHEVFVELIVPTRLSPGDDSALIDSVRQTGRLLTVEEGTRSLGWGAELLASVSERLGHQLKFAMRLAARDAPVPASLTLERAYLPGVDQIIQSALQLARRE